MGEFDQYYDDAGAVCRANAPLINACIAQDESRYTIALPTQSTCDAIEFLSGLGGDAAGAGRAMRRIGIDAPVVRAQYKEAIENLAREIAERLNRGESTESVARWASEQRRQIVRRMRAGSGPAANAIYEIRDWRRYGRGGRTYPNMVRYYRAQGVPASGVPARILNGATQSNGGVNQAMRGASYLRHGGRVLLVVGVAISAARIWNASERELPRVIGEELGGFIGGSLGAAGTVGACLVFGIATGGWGLLACGVVGGLAGGIIGSQVGGAVADGIYYSDASTPADQMGEVIIEIPADRIYADPPTNMCVVPGY